MTVQANLDQFYVTPGSQVNGVKNKYTFSMQSQIPFEVNDTLYFQFPEDLSPPTIDQAKESCQPLTNLVRISCQIAKGGIIITIDEPVPQDTTTTYGFTVDNIGNAISTKTTGPF